MQLQYTSNTLIGKRGVIVVDTTQITEAFGSFITVMKPQSLGDILAYGVFLFALLGVIMLPDGNGMSQNLLYVTIILAIFDVTVGQTMFFEQDYTRAFAAYTARIGLFLLPIIAAGAARIKGKKGKLSPIMCILAGVVGFFYTALGFLVLMSGGGPTSGIFTPLFFK
jgi:hypothetical protein